LLSTARRNTLWKWLCNGIGWDESALDGPLFRSKQSFFGWSSVLEARSGIGDVAHLIEIGTQNGPTAGSITFRNEVAHGLLNQGRVEDAIDVLRQEVESAEGPRRAIKLGERRGGRRRGSPNKSTLDVIDKLAALHCDPITGMAKLVMDKSNAPELRGRMFAELAQYVAPKRKALEHSGDAGMIDALLARIDD
jgi:hypothetical protein